MSKINVLLNENYTILKIIEDNTVTLMGSKYCPLSQTDIASIAKMNRITCGNIIARLKHFVQTINPFIDNDFVQSANWADWSSGIWNAIYVMRNCKFFGQN